MNWLKKQSISLKLVRRKENENEGKMQSLSKEKVNKTFRKSGELVFKSNFKKDNAWLLEAK